MLETFSHLESLSETFNSVVELKCQKKVVEFFSYLYYNENENNNFKVRIIVWVNT